MSHHRLCYTVCDLCKSRSPSGRDSLDSDQKARQKGWRLVDYDAYGNQGHACPRCAQGKADGEPLALLPAPGAPGGPA